MKKLFVTILAILYLTVSSGATVNLHYCMGKLMSWDLSSKSDGKCGTCGMQKAGHKGCCNDEQKTFKVDKDQKVSESSFHFTPISFAAIQTTNSELPIIYPSKILIDNPAVHGPPLKQGIPIFILTCNFRI